MPHGGHVGHILGLIATWLACWPCFGMDFHTVGMLAKFWDGLSHWGLVGHIFGNIATLSACCHILDLIATLWACWPHFGHVDHVLSMIATLWASWPHFGMIATLWACWPYFGHNFYTVGMLAKF